VKRVVSISLGSSKRNHSVEVEIKGERFRVERIGTDGDMEKMISMIRDLDGKVDAFGLGGMDLYLQAVGKRYVIREAQRVAKAAQKTPIVDGSGLKNTLERRVIYYLANNTDILSHRPKALVTSAMDRFGMADALREVGCPLIIGDFPFALGIHLKLSSLTTLAMIARVLAPLVVRFVPFEVLYPTGDKQNEVKNNDKFARYYYEAEIITGDYHFIHRYMPENMQGKVIITNTVTASDVEYLKQRGVKVLVTTTPELEGRSFGTNVMEALFVALAGSDRELTHESYEQLLDDLEMKPRILNFYS